MCLISFKLSLFAFEKFKTVPAATSREQFIINWLKKILNKYFYNFYINIKIN